MRVVAVNGSARAGGNTATLLKAALTPLREAGIECELIELAGKRVEGCTACRVCRKERDRRCHGREDFGNEVIAALDEADGIILGSPVYFAGRLGENLAWVLERLGPRE